MEPKKLLITGASGFVAAQIIPLLIENNIKLRLIARDADHITKIYGKWADCYNYDQLDNAMTGIDSILHLTTINNDSDASLNEFRAINVILLSKILAHAEKANVHNFIYISSHHAHGSSGTNYAVTKREAEAVLRQVKNIKAVNILVMPALYGNGKYAGKLMILSKFPNAMHPFMIKLFSCLKPLISAQNLTIEILEALDRETFKRKFISNNHYSNSLYNFAKRAMDLAICLFIFIAFWWLMVIIWGLIKFTSNGPAIFAQKRIGNYGEEFTCYKFRTMYLDTKEAGTHEITSDNITKIGKILRKLKLDELPQIWNILRNQMSLVGPRPCLPSQILLRELRQKKGVFSMKAGLTGLAQIQGVDMSQPDQLTDIEAQYLAVRTNVLDMQILIKTFLGSGQGDNVKT